MRKRVKEEDLNSAAMDGGRDLVSATSYTSQAPLEFPFYHDSGEQTKDVFFSKMTAKRPSVVTLFFTMNQILYFSKPFL